MPDRDKMPYESNLPLLKSIIQQAQEDGRISTEESELINRIHIDAREFEAAIVEARKQGLKSIEEVFILNKEKIIKNATEVAKEDGIITEDEQAIINKLISELELMNVE